MRNLINKLKAKFDVIVSYYKDCRLIGKIILILAIVLIEVQPLPSALPLAGLIKIIEKKQSAGLSF